MTLDNVEKIARFVECASKALLEELALMEYQCLCIWCNALMIKDVDDVSLYIAGFRIRRTKPINNRCVIGLSQIFHRVSVDDVVTRAFNVW